MTAVAYETLDRALDVRALDARLRGAEPIAIIEAAVEAFGDKLAVVSSFGAESAVLLHMAAQVKPDIPVLFLDTGMLFGQTLDYRQALATRLGLTDVRDLRPEGRDHGQLVAERLHRRLDDGDRFGAAQAGVQRAHVDGLIQGLVGGGHPALPRSTKAGSRSSAPR